MPFLKIENRVKHKLKYSNIYANRIDALLNEEWAVIILKSVEI